jgi:hypothetical protein
MGGNALRARTVLADARRAIDFALNASDGDWRFAFAGAVTLLRAVAHVLKKVDACESNHHRRVIEYWWNRVRSDQKAAIFNDFVCKNRDIILKEYQFNFKNEPPRQIMLEQGGFLLTEDGKCLVTEPVAHMVQTGPWRGHGALRLLEDAYNWWQIELDGIEEGIQKGRDKPVDRGR